MPLFKARMASLVVDDTSRVLDNAVVDALRDIRIDQASQKGSVLDVIGALTEHDSRHRSIVWQRLSEAYPDIHTKCVYLKINGKGRATWVADANTLIEIVWLLPGKAAKEFRRGCANYICRILGGDPTLVDEMELRVRHTPEAQREFFMRDAVVPDIERLKEDEQRLLAKRRIETDLAEREERIKRMRTENFKRVLSLLRDDEMDDRDRIYMHDLKRRYIDQLSGQFMGGNSPFALTSGGDEKVAASREEISIPTVCQKYGYRYNPRTSAMVGRIVARLYRARHGRDPPKRRVIYQGRPIDENAYFSDDEDLLRYAIGREMRPPPADFSGVRLSLRRLLESSGESYGGFGDDDASDSESECHL